MKEKIKEKVNLKLRLEINRKLYEEKIISLDVYQKMENYLIKKLNSLNPYMDKNKI